MENTDKCRIPEFEDRGNKNFHNIFRGNLPGYKFSYRYEHRDFLKFNGKSSQENPRYDTNNSIQLMSSASRLAIIEPIDMTRVKFLSIVIHLDVYCTRASNSRGSIPNKSIKNGIYFEPSRSL